MFDRAKNFVLSTGVFTDIGGYKPKIFVKKFYFGSEVGINSRKNDLILDNPRASDYQQILRGNIELLDKIKKHPRENAEENYEEYFVKIGNDKRWARFYFGESARADWKMELDILSRINHPRISQVFGICDSEYRPGLVFHDSGEGCDYEKYSAAIKNPIKRAIFYLKYLEEHNDATSYLNQWFGSYLEIFSTTTSAHIGENEGDRVKVDLNVKMDGRLNITLSVINGMHSNYKYGSTMFGLSVNNFPRSDIETLQIMQSDLSRDYVWPQSHNQMTVIIKTWLRAVTSVIDYQSLPSINNVVLGQGFTIYDPGFTFDDPGSYYAHGYYFEAVAQRALCYNSQHYDIDNIFQLPVDMVKIGRLKSLELTIDNVAKWTEVHGNSPILLTYNMVSSDEQLDQSWLAGMTKLRYPFSSIDTQFGIVTQIEIKCFVHIHQFRLLQYMKGNPGIKIYLFISAFEANQGHGNLIQPNVYWSLDQTGVERLSDLSAIQKGLAEIRVATMAPTISWWNHTYYEALHEIYNHLNLTASDVVELLGLQKQKYNDKIICYSVRSLSRMDALHIRSTVGKEEIKMQKPDVPYDWKLSLEDQISHLCEFERPDINSLSWIGITVLEDYKAAQATWYEAPNSRAKRIKSQKQKFLRKYGYVDDWVNVMKTDIDEIISTNEAVEGIESVEEWEEVAW